MLFLGVDLAWGEGSPTKPANESGIVCLDAEGVVVDAGWTRGLAGTVSWITAWRAQPCLLAVDAPLVVDNATGQRVCEREVGQRYGRWQVSANTTNMRSARQAGVRLLAMLQSEGWIYVDGRDGPPSDGHHAFECYPYTTLVGADEFGYDVERPRYKRKPKSMPAAAWRPARAAACDELLVRMEALATADPPLQIRCHPLTAELLHRPSPLADGPYKHREDLIDALLCAWTAALWSRHASSRVQVLGLDLSRPGPTIIAPARPEQRRA